MPEVRDEVSEGVRNRLAEAAELLAEAEGALEESSAERRNARPNIYRLAAAVKHAQKVLAWADPTVTRDGVSGEVVASATQARDTANEARDGDGGNLIDTAENLLAVAAQLEPRTLATEEEAKAAAASFRQSFGPRMRGLENEFESVKAHFDGVREATRESVETAVNRLNEIQGEIDAAKGRTDELIGEQDTKFDEAEAKRTERFDETVHKADEDLAAARTSFDERAAEARKHIAELEEEISQTAAALGGEATAIDNDNESREQAKKAFWWTALTVVLLVFAAGVPLAIGVEDASQSPESVAGKIAVGLILAGIAGYTAGVARHHRQRAATARRLALELNAFGPFIAPLEKDDRDDLRSTIIWRFFGPPEALNQEQDAEPTPGRRIVQLLMQRKESRSEPPKPDES